MTRAPPRSTRPAVRASPSPRPRRAAWLAGAAALALASAAQAQSARPAPSPAPSPDGLSPDEVYLEADQLADDRQTKIITAEGGVEARVQGRTVRADKLIYDTTLGTAKAVGHVSIVQPNGETVFADETELDDQMRAGVALGFSARLQNNVTIAAGAVVRRNKDVVELRSAVYTPCDVCKADGVTPKRPTYAIQARSIVEDQARKVIYYRDAVIRVKGVPVMWLPVLVTPTPSSERKSGFLPPRIGADRRRGASVQVPYYWAISPSSDLTASLQVNSQVNPLADLEYRRRFTNGYIDLRGGYTRERLFDNNGKYDELTDRSYVLANGRFTFDRFWEAGFGAERVTDPTLFRRYDVRSVFGNRGLYPADTDRLVSQLYTQRTDPTSYVSVTALSFQSIRAYGEDALGRPTFEGNKGFPIVAPLVEARYDTPVPILGGRLRLRGSAVMLSRNEEVISVSDPTGLQPLGPQRLTGQLGSVLPAGSAALVYDDSRRASARAEWRRDFVFRNGVKLQPVVQVRGDVYGVGSGLLTTSNGLANSTRAADEVTTIGQATGGFTASWPFIRTTANSSLILEPIVQALVSPRLSPDRNIPNEDSVAFEFDETTLFSLNRFPGSDLYESGARFNIGARANFRWGANRSATGTIGRVYRTEPDPTFTLGSGLSGRSSDYVATAQVSPLTGTNFFIRTRLDSETLQVRRNEAGLDVGWSRLSGSARYSYNESGFSIDPTGVTRIGRVEDASAAATVWLTGNWGVSGIAVRDLRLKTLPYSQVSLIYRDECVRVDVIYARDETYRAAIGASNSISVRLTLATLGATGSPFRP